MYKLSKSTRKDKKYMVKKDGSPPIHFGAKGYSDFTLHKDDDRKKRYVARHKKRENWNDPSSAGYWAKHLLWNQNSIDKSILDLKKRGIKVKR